MLKTFETPEQAYILNVDNGIEIARLIEQDRLFTQTIGGLLSEQPPDLLGDHAVVLDLACGPGTWACDLAFAYRKHEICVCGVDLSPSMVEYAWSTAEVQGLLPFTDFSVMDVRQPLRFDDNLFDLVNGRFLMGFMDTVSWPNLLAECRRVLKPGGILRLTECEMGLSSSPALQQMASLLTHALWKQGRTFSADGQTLGIAHRLGKLLLDAGLERMQQRAFVLDTSSYCPLHYHAVKVTDLTFTLLGPSLLASGLVEEETWQDLMHQMCIEMLQEDFTCISFGLTAWASKPAEPPSGQAQEVSQQGASQPVPLPA